MRVTIKDIAEYTGLSITTVSLVLNNKAVRIPIETRERVLDAVQKLRYHPNMTAISLVKRKTRLLGLIVSNIENYFFSTLAKGIEDMCRARQWNIILCDSSDMHERDLEYIQILSGRNVDGICFCISSDSDQERARDSLKLIEELELKCVIVDRHINGAQTKTVITDHELGAKMATNYLIAHGHRRIACITGPKRLETSEIRYRGYVDALEKAGITPDQDLVFEGDFTMESGRQIAQAMVEHEFTGLFAFNDLMALGAMKGLKLAGLSVPKDISVIGYDDILLLEMMDIPLTTIRQPAYELGREAARLLIDMVETEKNPEEADDNSAGQEEAIIRFEPRLILRESVATVSKRQE